MDNNFENRPCNCHNHHIEAKSAGSVAPKVKKTARSIPSVLMSVLIAFFPKCPLCWAVYMSMFSSIGLAQIPYMSWLLPVLLGFLALHLFLLFKKTSKKGYLPFFISLLGCTLLVLGRCFFPDEKWISFMGLFCIISGSLLNNFITSYLPLTFFKKLITS
jgi:mercuric ion transport protein